MFFLRQAFWVWGFELLTVTKNSENNLVDKNRTVRLWQKQKHVQINAHKMFNIKMGQYTELR